MATDPDPNVLDAAAARRLTPTRASRRRWTMHALGAPVLALLTLGLTVGTLEVACRWAHVDFEFKKRAFSRVPIFFRQPIVPVGTAFYRRPGPARWDGKVIDPMYRMQGGVDEAYRDETPVSIAYDDLGFRNPRALSDWQIVVAGDSFTELGFLPDEEIFTTRLGELLECSVRNLGVSYTGTLTQTFYLEAYGRSPATTDAIVVFFEGNDLSDNLEERERVEQVDTGGGRLMRLERLPTLLETLPPQTSFVRALYRWATRKSPLGVVDFTNAYFAWSGKTTPVTLDGIVLRDHGFDERIRAANADAIRRWGDAARRLGLRPWLVFMPSKRRVLDGYIVPAGPNALVPLPNGIPEFIESVAGASGVRFLDLTPALRAETAAGRLTYNGLYDTHLNRLGSHIVARVMADALAPAIARPLRSPGGASE